MQQSTRIWIRVVCATVGIFAIAIAVTAMLIPLPNPAAGGTCGPTKASEAPIAALVNPGSIGAGTEPAAPRGSSASIESIAQAAEHEEWLAFVGECQEATESRTLLALVILVLALAVGLGGPPLIFKLAGAGGSAAEERRRRQAGQGYSGPPAAGAGTNAGGLDPTPFGTGPVTGPQAVSAGDPVVVLGDTRSTEPYESSGLMARRPQSAQAGVVAATTPGAGNDSEIPSGWYPDPMAPATGYRWWDGHDWGPAAPVPSGTEAPPGSPGIPA